MFTLAFLTMLQINVLIEGGVSNGTSFTNTKIFTHPSVSAHVFPFQAKSIGFFNTFEWNNSHSKTFPFEVNAQSYVFISGITFRMPKKTIQPSLRAGIMSFYEHTKINYFNSKFLEGDNKKKSLFLGSGAYIKIWRRFYVDPEISLAVVRRPPWKMTVRAGWMF